MNRVLRTAVALAALAAATVPARAAPPYAGAQVRYWSFSNANDLRDLVAYWVPGPVHVQLEVWDFARGPDQFRPEIGVHLRDARRSVYTAQWRHELDQERWWLGTEQVLSRRFVGRAEVSPITAIDGTLWVWDAGTDLYWSDYGFASVTLLRDPRAGGLWVVPLRVRAANARNDWVQATLAPAARRSLGWALEAKLRGLRLGVERNNRYDFTTLDNTVWTVGVETLLP